MRKAIAVAAMWLAAALAGAEGPSVYLSVDMEGICGVVDADQTTPEGRDFAFARRWMAEDVNAVIAGLRAAGAGRIVVNDSHGAMRNILPSDLRSDAALISGSPKPLAMLEGLDASFAAVVFVGYHARAGTASAILDHTISSRTISSIAVNGVEMPELGLNAMIAGSFGVPVIMISGDAATCEQATELLGAQVVTVAVKEGLGRTAARLVPMAEARRRLEAGAAEALRGLGRRRPYQPTAPYRFEVAFLTSAQAEVGEGVPGVERTDGRTLAFTSPDAIAGFRTLRALIALAGTR